MANELDGEVVYEHEVQPDWIDYNGHMNVAYYVLAFDHAVDALWARIGITGEYIRVERGSTFGVECHVTYQRELTEGDPLLVTTQVLGYDAKRIHQFQRMYHGRERFLAATAEWMNLHVDLDARKVTPWPDRVLRELEAFTARQAGAAYPEEAGRRMQIPEPIYTLPGGAAT